MNAPAPESDPAPKPPKSRRMVVWMIAVPAVILLAALAAANWRTFHLAYCKNLMGSSDYRKRHLGLNKLINVHFRRGLSREEVSRLLLPLQLQEGQHDGFPGGPLVKDHTIVGEFDLTWTVSFHFDQREGLDSLSISVNRKRVPRKGDDFMSVGGGGGTTVTPGADGRFKVHEEWAHAGE